MTVAVATAVAVTASASACLSISLPQPQPQPASASASACFSLSLSLPSASASASACLSLSLHQPQPQPQPASASASISLSLHQPPPQPASAFKMWPGNGVLGTRRTRSGLQLAPGIQNVAREWSSGNSKTTKCVTVCLKRGSAAPVRHPPRPPWGVMMLSFEILLETYQQRLLGKNAIGKIATSN